MKKTFYPGAPESDDKNMVNTLFRDYCNCYSYAVQDYFAGHLAGGSGSERSKEDGGYLPRPGQTRGNSYTDLKGKNVRGMRRALHEDGLLFAGKTYPKKVPDDKYVICCFLEPEQYHFIRQNQDGSWSSKNGRGEVNSLDNSNHPLTNPENFYQGDPKYTFVGYFFVPKGGIHVGVRAYEEKLLKNFERRGPRTPAQRKLRTLLKSSVEMTQKSDEIKKSTKEMWKTDPHGLFKKWETYLVDLCALSYLLKTYRFHRRSLLKLARTSKKARG